MIALNILNVSDIILHTFKLQILSSMCKQGFDDALRFLHRNNLLNCTRCLAVQSTYIVQKTIDDSMEYDPECLECKMHRQVRELILSIATMFSIILFHSIYLKIKLNFSNIY